MAAAPPLHIVYAVGPGGGAETYARQIAPALAARGQRVTVLYLLPPGHRAGGPSRDGAVRLAYVTTSNAHYYYSRVHRLLPAGLRRLAPAPALLKVAEGSLALRRALRRIARQSGGIDLVELPEEVAFPALWRGLAPYAVKLHSSDATWRHFCGEGLRPEDRQRMRLEADLLRRAALVSAPSAAVADYTCAVCRYPRARVAVLPYPLDIDLFSPTPRDAAEIAAPALQGRRGDDMDDTQGSRILLGARGARCAARPPSSDGAGATPALPVGAAATFHEPWGNTENLSVLYVGRLDVRKGLTTLMRAAEAILTRFPAATLDIVGGETPELTAAALLRDTPAALHRRIVFHGRIVHDDLPGYYRRAAVCVAPSRWDNSPNTVYEAMSCGRPVVAGRVGGIPELVVEGRTGLLVPRDDPAALAAAVNSLLADPARRAAMGRAARAAAVARFDPGAVAMRTLELYRLVLNPAYASPPPSDRELDEERSFVHP